jgi:outer membrane lipoprotein-sorting protein
MKAGARPASVGFLFLPLLLAGCSLLPTTRKLPVPRPPALVQTATPEELVTRLNQRWAAVNSLTAKVEIRASVTNSKKGVATDYPSAEGHILLRKPAMMRVVGQLYGVRIFDMASDGKNFTLSIPSKSKAIKGANSLKKKSANALENLRPDFFFDALVVRGLDHDDLYSVGADSETVEDTARKHLLTVPEYILSISRRKAGTNELTPVRVVTFNRDDLQPYEQDIYSSAGVLETQVFYSNYQDFEGSEYPSTIKIRRLLDEIQIVLTVEDVKENLPLTDDQFVVSIPAKTVIQNLE